MVSSGLNNNALRYVIHNCEKYEYIDENSVHKIEGTFISRDGKKELGDIKRNDKYKFLKLNADGSTQSFKNDGKVVLRLFDSSDNIIQNYKITIKEKYNYRLVFCTGLLYAEKRIGDVVEFILLSQIYTEPASVGSE